MGKTKRKKIQDIMKKAVVDNIDDLEEVRQELRPTKAKKLEDL